MIGARSADRRHPAQTARHRRLAADELDPVVAFLLEDEDLAADREYRILEPRALRALRRRRPKKIPCGAQPNFNFPRNARTTVASL